MMESIVNGCDDTDYLYLITCKCAYLAPKTLKRSIWGLCLKLAEWLFSSKSDCSGVGVTKD